MAHTFVVIPARGGSKGIPRKNLLPVAGKPLIVWTIEQALAITTPRTVVVSTEDAEIAAVAADAGAQIVNRPLDLAQDESPTEPVVRHAMTTMPADTDAVMLLQATSPIRNPGTLDRAVQQFAKGGCDSIVGVVPQAPFLWWDGDRPRADYDVAARPRRQDLRADQLRYRETGSVYLTRPHIYTTHDNRLGGTIGLFVMDDVEGIDIDTDLDLSITAQRLTAIASGACR